MTISEGTETLAIEPVRVTLRSLADHYAFLNGWLADAIARSEAGEDGEGEAATDDAMIADLARQMLEVGDALDKKAIAVMSAQRAMELRGKMRAAEAKVYEDEAKRIKALAERDANLAEKLKAYTLREMQAAGVPEIQGPRFRLKVADKRAYVDDNVNMADLPEKFKRIKKEPNKVGILAHFKATGEIPPGVSIVTNEKRLDVR